MHNTHREKYMIAPHFDKQSRILKDLCSGMGMPVNIAKTKILLIKSIKFTFTHFLYDNRNLEKTTPYTYLGIDIHDKLNQNYNIEKRNNGGRKAYFGLENNCKSKNLVIWDKINSPLKFFSLSFSCMGMNFGVVASLENL